MLSCRNAGPYCQIFEENQKAHFMRNPFISKYCFQIKNTKTNTQGARPKTNKICRPHPPAQLTNSISSKQMNNQCHPDMPNQRCPALGWAHNLRHESRQLTAPSAICMLPADSFNHQLTEHLL